MKSYFCSMKAFESTTLLFILMLIACGGPEREPVDHPQSDGFYSKLKQKIKEDTRPSPPGLGIIRYDQDEHDFGEINEGDIVYHKFQFTNVGEGPLSIEDVESRCGCTIPEWPKKPIMPGEKGEILVSFDSKHRPEHQSKAIIVYTNGRPYKTALVIRAYVKPKES